MMRPLAKPLVALAVALTLCGCGAAERDAADGTPGLRTIEATGSRSRVHTDDARGLSVHYPHGWSVAQAALTNVVVPRELLALTTFPLQGGAKGGGACAIKGELERMPADGALIYLLEYRPLLGDVWSDLHRSSFPPKPDRFRVVRAELQPSSCGGRGLGYTTAFNAADRPVTMSLAFGNDVTDARLREIEEVVNSLELGELPPPPPDPYAGWPLINDNPGDSVRPPPGWAASASMFPPDKTPRPRPLFFASNQPLHGLPARLVPHVDRLPSPWPAQAIANHFPRDGVLLWILEEASGEASDEFPPSERAWLTRDAFRPAHVPIKTNSELSWLRTGGSFKGYRFSVWIASGPEATSEDRELALKSAASLAVSGCWRDSFDDCPDG